MNRVHAVASAIYKVAVRNQYIQLNPLTLVDYLKTDIQSFEYWSAAEVNQFLDYCRSTNHPRYLLYFLAYETGMRVSELIGLQWDAIDLEAKLLTVRRSYSKHSRKLLDTTKSGKPRVLGINPEMVRLLRISRNQSKSDFVFSRSDGRHLSCDSLYDQFKADQVKAHVRIISIHDMRHTYASHYMMNDGNIYDLKELLGHANIKTTERYAHLAPAHLASKASIVCYVPAVNDATVIPLISPVIP